MRRRGMRLLRVSVLIGLVASMLMAAQPAIGGPQFAPKRTTLVADSMTGAQVVPGPGDPDGSGTARLPNASDISEICWNINTELIEVPLTGALIHAASAGEVGVVALQLFSEVNDPDPSGCRTADSDLLRDLNQKSREFYLEISNFAYPGGAIRGQLHHEEFDA